ncbi:MAG: glutaredoxin [Candidatus Magasanikbacteria bacterium CG11_big_fil_rev_8_21_14_0_20_43_7]|uniref:Glutaredoxin n=1 Tax=Candidatus Magasanikbacteria bacterium CG11_big_fil_rev_8_21_14_0_20_43_7 TaxID=1974654 RepID=A0A2H0N2F1_9BACT|nr:MAG: glutaredoxin [Candidatus Magasanikbacteria bacterium CG11_big_fil_rev_8_21_14_0_20_43_7]
MLELYQMEHCPYCAKVRKKLEDLDLDFVCHTSKKGSKKREILKKLGGQEMVPFLIDTTDPSNLVMMYESGDIVEYLDERYG